MPNENQASSSDKVAEIVVGLSDGLTVPFALATGMSAVATQNATILLAGLAATILGGVAMGLARYYGGVMESKNYDFKEDAENIGLDAAAQQAIHSELQRERDEWKTYMTEYEAEQQMTDPVLARKSATYIAMAYMAGGVVPLLPYMFTALPATGMWYSVALTLVCLFIFGYLKAIYTGMPALAGAMKAVVFGGFAALGAHLVATLFR